MIRLILTIFLVIALYFGFTAINEYDSNVDVQFLDYSITISAFFLVCAIISFYIIFSITLKILLFILNLPWLISSKIKMSKVESQKRQLIKSYSFVVSGNSKLASEIINKIKSDLPSDLDLHSHVVLSVADQDDEQKIYHLKYLLDHSEYKNFASRALASYYFKYQYYQQCLEYAKHDSAMSNDHEMLEMLVESYAKLGYWDEFDDAVSKLRSHIQTPRQPLLRKISEGYFMAAQSVLESENNERAVGYLELALLHRPDMLEAVELLCHLNMNDGRSSMNKDFIENAFAISPSLELCLLYEKSTDFSKKEIYQQLSSLVSPSQNVTVFLAIASYLELKDEINLLKESII